MKLLHMTRLLIITAIVSSQLAACKKMLEVAPPVDRINREIVFTSDATAISAISGLYTQMIRTNQQFTSSAITLYAGLSADEIYNTTASANLDEFTNNDLTAANPLLRSNLWAPAYNLVFQANNIIEGLQQSTGVSAGVKSQLTGEAMFVRAFCHFYLAQLFGDVPLILSTDYKVNSIIPRTPLNTVYEQVINDLSEAKNLMSATYPSQSRVRPNKWTASALLARVHLYRGEWDKAEVEATQVITSGNYSLVTNLLNVFLPASTETIWQLMPTSATVNTWEGNFFIPVVNVTPSYPLTTTLISAFNAADQRKQRWVSSVTVGAATYYYPFKYKVKTATMLTEYYVVLRLAEQFLIRAEARAQQHKITLAQADLNTVRNRAGLPNSTTTDEIQLLAQIQNERRVELFAEWGHRWFDLKRTRTAGSVLAAKPGWQATDTLYPVPNAEILRNPFLTQNPGY